jgi:hypothetical protein
MTIRQKVKVLPGGNIQIHDPELPDGAEAEVVVTVDSESKISEEAEGTPDSRPFWERILELGASIPEEEWDKVPRDLSKNLDHYLYGAPKEEE